MSTFILNGLLAAFTSEFCRRSFALTASKVMTTLDGFTPYTSITSSITEEKSATEPEIVVDQYLKQLYIGAKVETASAIIDEHMNEPVSVSIIPDGKSSAYTTSKAVLQSCIRLHDTIVKIHKELDKLKICLVEHKLKYFAYLRTPDYLRYLVALKMLMVDFEIHYTLLKDSILMHN
jgi:hypothetical protein